MLNYTLSFSNLSDIRMGSPYNIGTANLSGPYVPNLPDRGFQDVGLVSKNGQHCYLVKWDFESNNPGFRIWHIDGVRKEVIYSERYSGICEGLKEIYEGLEIRIAEYSPSTKEFVDRIDYFITE